MMSFSASPYKNISKGYHIPGIKDTIDGDSLIFPFDDYVNDPLSVHKTSPLFLKNPSTVQSSVKYDPKTGKFVFYDKIGNFNYRNPYYMSFEDFMHYTNEQEIRNYWAERSALENIKGENSLVDRLVNKNLIVPIQGFDKIFGSNQINIKPQGTAELIFGLKINNTENPALTKELQKSVNFDFDMKIKMGVAGQIGDKMKLGINFDTDATFEFENNAKLAYEGKEDEILQKIEAGNVTMPLSGSLITGSHNLFGIKTELKFGNLLVTNVFSQQKGQSKTVEVQGGATTTPFEITADDYDANRHYFISQYFRDRYNDALKNLPVVSSNINIRKIEVWVTNRSGKFDNSRNIIAFTDLGENGNHIYSTDNFSPSGLLIPDNSTNDLYGKMTNQPGLRDIANVSTILSSYINFEAGDDYEKVQNARLLSTSEYTFNPTLGYISLNSALNNDEVLAVAFEYENTSDGKTYRVGEFSNEEPSAPDALFMKLLKPTTLSTENPTWDLMMKNVYSFNAYQVNNQDFKLDVMYRNDKTGSSINYLPAGEIQGQILLKVLGLDNLNKNNEPGSDGYFDFIDKITINASNGKIYFPVTEPFGSYLKEKITGGSTDPEINRIADQYTFPELYEETQSQARQIAEKNKFFLKGEYRSSGGSEINLNAMNIPEGSVTVTAGGAILTENTDYTVDYNLGRVTIINQSLLESGTPIKISLESNSMFDIGTKSMIGTHLDYRISDNFNIGATIMHLHQKPLTSKVNIGDIPVSNTIWGTNIDFNQEVPFLTKFVDKFIPFVKTKTPSHIDFSGEFAQLIPGHPKILGDEGYANIDDFEGAKVTIDLKSPSRWKISSTPQGQPDLFPEADSTNTLSYGYNRAKLAWYNVNRDFLAGSGALSYLTVDSLSDHRIREIPEQEIFPNRDPEHDIPQFLYVLNLGYYPNEKGPYNFDPPGGLAGVSSGINDNGNLNDPGSRWAGISQSLTTNDFEEANIEFIEFWMLDPFIYDSVQNGGDIYFNLGSISEDILKDSRQAFENGLPTSANVINVDTTVWGRVPILPRITEAFATEPANARQYQDVGLDGLSDADENTFFSDYLQSIANAYGTGSKAYQNALADPSNDDYLFYKDPSYDTEKTGILDRYKKYNNQEGNSYSKGDIVTATELRPDMEDINRDYTLTENEAYFQYKVHIAPGDMQVGENYITDIRKADVRLRNENEETVKWYHFKIPLADYQKKIGQIEDFKSIRFIRLFMKDWQKDIILRFAEMDLVRGDWRKYRLSLLEGTEGSGTPEYTDAQLDVNTVNVEENSSREPVNYVLPPKVTREISPGNPYLQQLNEQAISLKVINLSDGDARAAYKNANLDVRQYKKLQMFIHAEALEGEVLNDDDLCAFIRIGSDYKENYYEYEIPLKLTEPGYYDGTFGSPDRELVWRPDNMLDVEFDVFQAIKQERNQKIREGADINLTSEYSEYIDESGRRVSITGTPNLSNIRTIMIGIRNRKKENNILPDDGLPKSIEVWMNELRLSGFNEHGGWATRGRLQTNLADFSTLALATEYSTPGFGGLEQSVDQRQQSTDFNYDFSASTELGKFFPKKYGIRVPLYFGYSESKSNPEYDPLNPDIKMTASLRNMSQKERNDYLKISQDYIKRKSINLTNIRISGNKEKKIRKNKNNEQKDNKKKPNTKKNTNRRKNTPIWALSNWSASYGYNELLSRNINTDHNLLKIHTGAITYNYNITPKNIKPFSKVKLFRKKAFRIIKDFNFYYSPSMIAFRTDMRKSYNEVLLRNIENSGVLLDETYDKQFVWNRNYDIRYNLSRNLKFTYSANNMAWIGEPEGKIDKSDEQKWKEYKNSVLDSVQNFGRTTDFHQKINATWNIPINQLPLLDWVNANARYNADYYWTIGPRTADTAINLGNTIRNNQNMQLSAQANFDRLYRKVKFLKRVDNKFRSNRKQAKKKFKDVKFTKENVSLKKNKPRSIVHNLKTENVKLKVTDSKGKEIKGRTEIVNENKVKFYAEKTVKKTKINVTGKKEVKENIFNVISDYTLYALMSVRNVSLTYSQNNGTVVPGYMRKSNYMGFEKLSLNNLNNNAPGWKFIAGIPDSHFPEIAAANHWLSGDTLLNTPIVQTGDVTYNFKATLKPVKGLRIDLTADRRESRQNREFWTTNDYGNLQAQNQSEEGTFSMSFLSIRTAFDKVTDSTYNSTIYTQFLDYRTNVANRLADERSLSGIPYDRNQLNNPDSINDYVNQYPYGYNPVSKDVMLPAFLAAYSGQDINSIGLKMLPVIPFPNWRLKYDGLTYYDGIKKYFKRITINHAYRSTYTVSSFQSNSAFQSYNSTGFTDIQDELTSTYYVTEFLADAVTIDEKFTPLLGIDMQWRNDMSTKLEYKQSRMLTLSFSNNTLTELIRKEYVFGFGYKVPDLEIPMMIQGNQKLFKSDLNFRFDFTFSDNYALIRRIKEADNQLSAGQKNLAVKVSVDYNLDKVTLRLFYDRIVNTPRVSTSFKTSNTHIGFSLRFNLANI